jgi:hypothetical protein
MTKQGRHGALRRAVSIALSLAALTASAAATARNHRNIDLETLHAGNGWVASGVGIESAIYAEEIFVLASRNFAPEQVLERFNAPRCSRPTRFW